MKTLLRAAWVLALLAPFAAHAAAKPPAGPAPIEVMIVGDFHMSNPGRDQHNLTVDDILAPKRQEEIAAVTDALNRFHPTAVAAEWPADIAGERYARYLAGTLPPSHNEVVQLGFRLARTAGLKQFRGIDVDGDFPYDPVDAYAKAHGQTAILDQAQASIQAQVDRQAAMLQSSSVSAVLRYLNDPVRIRDDNGFYRTTLRIGGGAEQPGAELLTAWYHRNFLICANLVQMARPGDRIVVFYGAGHAFLLRQCVSESPGFRLVEPNAYLPR
jgi:hypothetical protein